MKKSLRTIVRGAWSVLIVTLVFSFNVLTAYADTGTINANGVNVRSQPTVNSNQVTSVNAGATFEIEGVEKDATGMDWYKITVNGQTGYVRSDLMTVQAGGGNANAGATTGAAEPPAEEQPFQERNAVVSATAAINVRNDAGATYASVANLQPNTPVVVIGETTAADGAKWYKIRYDENGTSKEGFVLAAFLTVDEQSAAQPDPGTPANPADPTTTPGTPEQPVTEDPSSGDNSGMMGQQYTVVYDLDNNNEMAPWLMDNNSGSRTNIQQLLTANQELARLQGVEGTNTALKVLSIILGIIALVAIVLLVMVVLRYRRYRDEDYDDYDDGDEDDGEEDEEEGVADAPRRSFFGRRKAASYDDEEGDEEDDEYDDEEEEDEPRRGGGFFSRFRRRRDEDYDDEDEDYDDEDEYEEEEPRAIRRVYQPERTPEADSRRRPRNFMDDDADDFEYGFLNDDN
ncbi:MAG: SH3 domain-containing protein [Lachnospiraceae bacterium]|nr:SH3 domain-containing protein [Lachnospiraceae bacterium]